MQVIEVKDLLAFIHVCLSVTGQHRVRISQGKYGSDMLWYRNRGMLLSDVYFTMKTFFYNSFHTQICPFQTFLTPWVSNVWMILFSYFMDHIYGPCCPLSPKRPFNLLTHSLIDHRSIWLVCFFHWSQRRLAWYCKILCQFQPRYFSIANIDWLVQVRRNSIANTLELRLSFTNPLIYNVNSAW